MLINQAFVTLFDLFKMNNLKTARSSPKIQRYSMKNLIVSRFINGDFPRCSHFTHIKSFHFLSGVFIRFYYALEVFHCLLLHVLCDVTILV